jgi:flagellar biogenesis protein FliO
MGQRAKDKPDGLAAAPGLHLGGLAGWLLLRLREWLRRTPRPRPHLTLVERIALAPRQSLVLVEAEGRRLLVVTAADGAAAFYPLDEPQPAAHSVSHSAPRPTPYLATRRAPQASPAARISAAWPRVSSRVSW